MDGSNLILGYLYDRSLGEVMAFLSSVYKAKLKNTKTVILGGYVDGGGFTYRGIRDMGVELIEVPHMPEKYDLSHYVSRRFCWYDWYLNQHPEYDNVMLTGVRDVIVQSDPFVYDTGNALCCFLESRLIKECSWNRMWQGETYGQDELEKIWENPISCAEIVIGKYARVVEYIKLMMPSICGPNYIIRIIDQAVHNRLLWNNKLGEVRLFKPGEGPVMTMGYRYSDTSEDEIATNENLQVLNDDGSVVPVIHQYDRFPNIDRLLRAKYGGK